MRRLALVVALLMSACAAGTSVKPPASPLPEASPPGAPVASAPASPAPAASPSPLVVPTGELLYAVVEPQSFNANKVAIAGLDGYARAKTAFSPIKPPYVGCLGPVMPVQSYAIGGRVYFLDGGGTVRYLDVKGHVVEVAGFPRSSSQQEVSFAVSPDGFHLLGTVLTLPPKPAADPCSSGVDFAPGDFAQDIYSADAGGQAHLLSHQAIPQKSELPFLAFIGWDAIGPIATAPTVLGTQGGGPTHWWGHPVRTDLSGKVLGDLGGQGCHATDSLPDGTVACGLDSGTVVRLASGADLWHASQQLSPGFLSPDAQRVAGFGDNGQVAIGSDGSVVNLFGEFFVSGWLDNVTVIGNFQTGEVGTQKIAPLGKGIPQGYAGSFVGVVQHP